MAIAALTPRVRTIVTCDSISVRLDERSVFTLEGVRQQLHAVSFPCSVRLWVFLVLSCARHGNYAGRILVVNDRTDRSIRYTRFGARFEDDNQSLSLQIDLGDCVFPEAGLYRPEVYFFAAGGSREALKGDCPFTVLATVE